MEKYLIILLILGLMFFVQTNTATSENFEGTSSSTIVDDWQAINTLAQLSAQLMLGGLTVPGELKVTGNLSATGTLAITGAANVGSLTTTGATNINTLTATGAANVGSLKIGDAILTWDSAQKCLSSTNTIKTPTSAAADTLSTTGAANVGSLTANGSISSGNIKIIDNKTVTIPETNKNVIIYNHSNSGSGCSVDTSGNFTATNNLWIGNLSKSYTQTNTFDSAGLVVKSNNSDKNNRQLNISWQPGISYSDLERNTNTTNIGFSDYGCNINSNGNIFTTGSLRISDHSNNFGILDKGYVIGGNSNGSNFKIGEGQLSMTDLSNGVIQLSPNNITGRDLSGNGFSLSPNVLLIGKGILSWDSAQNCFISSAIIKSPATSGTLPGTVSNLNVTGILYTNDIMDLRTKTPRIQLYSDGNNYYNTGENNIHYFRALNGGDGCKVEVKGDLTVVGNITCTGTINGLVRYTELIPFNVAGGAYQTKFVVPNKMAAYYVYASRGPGAKSQAWVSAILNVFPVSNAMAGAINYTFTNYNSAWGTSPSQCFTLYGFGCAPGLTNFEKIICLMMANDTPSAPNGWNFIVQQMA